MELQNLHIRKKYEYEAGLDRGYHGTIEFKNSQGSKIELVLTHAICQQMLNIVAEDMARATKELANNLTKEVFTNAVLAPIAPAPAIRSDDDIPF